MSDWGWWMMVLWPLVWAVLLGLGLWGILFWTRGSASPASPGPRPRREKTARELLDEQLARGEIDLKQYQRLRDTLAPRNPTAA